MALGINLTFVGMTVVFLSLVVLAGIISLFSKAFASMNSTKSEKRLDTGDDASILEIDETEETFHETAVCSDDELVAVLTAAVMASMGNRPDCKIRVTSFRRIPQMSPVWNLAGRDEYISGKL